MRTAISSPPTLANAHGGLLYVPATLAGVALPFIISCGEEPASVPQTKLSFSLGLSPMAQQKGATQQTHATLGKRGGVQERSPKALTGSREQLGNLFALWHVLDGSIDLLSDGQHLTLPFQVAVPSVHQPVYVRKTPVTACPSTWPRCHH